MHMILVDTINDCIIHLKNSVKAKGLKIENLTEGNLFAIELDFIDLS